MIEADNIDFAIELQEEGIFPEVDYINEFFSMNLIEIHADRFTTNPYSTNAEKELKNLKKLIDLGVNIKENDGTRDALDIALFAATRQEKDQAEKILKYALKLNEFGIYLQSSHNSLIDELEKRHPHLHKEYTSNLN
ncbi:hypothetical protein [Gilvimarinus polysaccharolyticus]|uniref:hypothetical protein n=1 Tax=Gilvimarinus polysaccharolyticus TaxID=863921 RepID=UPI0012FAAAB5|nr:hypothetical protein [Gilvimarinus polysaccharolyticus]